MTSALDLSLVKDSGGVQAVARAAAILLDVRAHPATGVTETSLRLGLHKSTVSRLLATLVGSGLIVDADGVYQLGPGLAVPPVIYRAGPTLVVGGKRSRPVGRRRTHEAAWRPTEPDWRPLCMSAEELAEWQESADGQPVTTRAHERAAIPCTDCTLGFAAEQRAIGKCNGRPGGAEEDDELDVTPALEATRMSTAVRTLVSAPCESCLHRAVCSRRAAILDLDTADVEIETLPEGLSVALSAVVECDAYLREPKSHKALPAAVIATGRAKPQYTPEGLAALRLNAERNRAKLAEKRAAVGNVRGEPIRQLETVETVG